jgi:hypothetical protein
MKAQNLLYTDESSIRSEIFSYQATRHMRGTLLIFNVKSIFYYYIANYGFYLYMLQKTVSDQNINVYCLDSKSGKITGM